MSLLILGGTMDARSMADTLIKSGIDVIYSIKGLVRTPKLDCEILVGGFSSLGGLPLFIKKRNISAILDATHPYASNMTQQAVDAAKACDIPLWIFHRKPWVATHEDHWIECIDWHQALAHFERAQNIFLSAGQLPEFVIDVIRETYQKKFFMLRTAVKPAFTLPKNIHWIKAIGPFEKRDEKALLKKFDIDMILSKNSGGDSTFAKIEAAREQNIPVIMFKRPEIPDNAHVFYDVDTCIHACKAHFDLEINPVNTRDTL